MEKFINWIGSKQKLLPKIIPLIPKKFKTYFEPFLGSGAVYLALKPHKAVLNDHDAELIALWRYALTNPHAFTKKAFALENFIYQHLQQEDQKLAFNTLRQKYNNYEPHQTCLTKAVLFFVLHKYCFRGIASYTKKDKKLKIHFSYKGKMTHDIVNYRALLALKNHFQKKKHVLVCEDYQKIISQARQDDFLFVDPPYYNGKNVALSAFYETQFDFKEHQALCRALIKSHQRGAKWLYTNYDTQEIRKLFQNFYFASLPTSTAHNLTPKTNPQEIIIANYLC